jgi:hypothetical protein
MTLTPPASGWDGTHLMLRGHVARQRSGRRRVFSSINAGAARLFVMVGLVAYVIGLCLSGKRRQGLHTCQRRTPTHTRVLLAPGPCWPLDLPEGSGLVYRGPMSFCGAPALLGCGVSPCHVASFGLPIRRDQTWSSVRLEDVAWV